MQILMWLTKEETARAIREITKWHEKRLIRVCSSDFVDRLIYRNSDPGFEFERLLKSDHHINR